MNIRLVTVIWGKRFVDIFLRVTLRSLLAEGNLPALSRRHRVSHTIYTTKDGERQIRSSPLYAELAGTVMLEFSPFTESEIDSTSFASHWILWRRGFELAKRNCEILFLIIPDNLYGRDTLSCWAERLERGARCVIAPSPQVVGETVRGELDRRFPGDGTFSIDGPQLIDLLTRHLHPLAISMFRDSPCASKHPEHCLRPADKGAGIAMRVLTSNPFCIDPNHFDVTPSLCPTDRIEDIAFEPCRSISLEPLLKHLNWYLRPWRMGEDRLSNLGGWLNHFAAPANLAESRVNYRFAAQGAANDTAFRRVEGANAFFVTQTQISRGFYRIRSALLEQNCHLAAQVLAASLFVGRLRRRWTIRGPATVLVPEDRVFQTLGPLWMQELLRPGNERSLVGLVLGHVLRGRHWFSSGDALLPPPMDRGNGTHRSITGIANGVDRQEVRQAAPARIVRGPFAADEHLIYVVDRLICDPVNEGCLLPSRPARENRDPAFSKQSAGAALERQL